MEPEKLLSKQSKLNSKTTSTDYKIQLQPLNNSNCRLNDWRSHLIMYKKLKGIYDFKDLVQNNFHEHFSKDYSTPKITRSTINFDFKFFKNSPVETSNKKYIPYTKCGIDDEVFNVDEDEQYYLTRNFSKTTTNKSSVITHCHRLNEKDHVRKSSESQASKTTSTSENFGKHFLTMESVTKTYEKLTDRLKVQNGELVLRDRLVRENKRSQSGGCNKYKTAILYIRNSSKNVSNINEKLNSAYDVRQNLSKSLKSKK